jgi:hypothetical protein
VEVTELSARAGVFGEGFRRGGGFAVERFRACSLNCIVDGEMEIWGKGVVRWGQVWKGKEWLDGWMDRCMDVCWRYFDAWRW